MVDAARRGPSRGKRDRSETNAPTIARQSPSINPTAAAVLERNHLAVMASHLVGRLLEQGRLDDAQLARQLLNRLMDAPPPVAQRSEDDAEGRGT